MKILFDTSVLIAAFVESHPKHKTALAFLVSAKKKEFQFLVSSHSILEVYSVLTSAPFKPKITPIIATQLIENNIINIAKIICLGEEDYWNIIKKMNDSNFSGGIIYDAIAVECALIAKADEILTLNSKDFLLLTDGKLIKVSTL